MRQQNLTPTLIFFTPTIIVVVEYRHLIVEKSASASFVLIIVSRSTYIITGHFYGKINNHTVSDNIVLTIMVVFILIAGAPAVGKTTLLKRLISPLQNDHPNVRLNGFFTREVRDVRTRQQAGFECVQFMKDPTSTSKRQCILASLLSASPAGDSYEEGVDNAPTAVPQTPSPPPLEPLCRVGPYRIHVQRFEEFLFDTNGNFEATTGDTGGSLMSSRTNDVLFVELGRMELMSEKYSSRIEELFDETSNIMVVATMPDKGGGHLIDRLRQKDPRCYIFFMTKANRNTVYIDIHKKIMSHVVP